MQLTLRITGFIASLLLTLGAYFIILNPHEFGLENKAAVLSIFALALLQAIVQLLCFINLWREKGMLWNLYVFLSTVSIIFVVIFFSIWIMDRLNYNMMPDMAM
jgi:cytochrome o ubiquinol oxidase subunit IV